MSEERDGNAGTPASPEPAAPAVDPGAATPVPARDSRPKPEFGEYAPEGWEWKPEGAADEAANTPGVGTRTPGAGGAGTGAAGGAAAPATVQGVPHNLGANLPRPARKGSAGRGAAAAGGGSAQGRQAPGGQAPGAQSQGGPSQHTAGAPYRAPAAGDAPAPHQAAQFQQAQLQAPGQGGYAQQKPANLGDRVITILLLVIGAFGALYSALTLMGLRNMFAMMEDAPGVTELTPPAWLDMTGKVAGMVVLVLYGLMLVYSIRRLRARKLTFWVPLVLGVVVSISVIVIVASAMFSTPELMEIMSDPSASAELLEYLQGFPTS